MCDGGEGYGKVRAATGYCGHGCLVFWLAVRILPLVLALLADT